MMETTLLNIGTLVAWQLFTILTFLIIPVGLWLWSLVDLLRSNFSDSTNKLIWVIVIVFIPVLGALLYLLIGRKQKIKLSNL